MNLTIITGSTLGSAEYLAEDCATFLESEGINTTLFHGPNWEDIQPIIRETSQWLIVSSTHGAGEVPENLQPLLNDLLKNQVDLSHIRFAIIGLGDRQYDTFCGAVTHINHTLTLCGAKAILPPLTLDMPNCDSPESSAEQWLSQLLDVT